MYESTSSWQQWIFTQNARRLGHHLRGLIQAKISTFRGEQPSWISSNQSLALTQRKFLPTSINTQPIGRRGGRPMRGGINRRRKMAPPTFGRRHSSRCWREYSEVHWYWKRSPASRADARTRPIPSDKHIKKWKFEIGAGFLHLYNGSLPRREGHLACVFLASPRSGVDT